MIKFDLSNLQEVAADHGVSGKELSDLKNRIPDYLKKIEARDQDFYKIVDDEDQADSILNFAKVVEGKFKDIVVLAIGGSSLGTICLHDSLKHLFERELTDRKAPRLHVLDNIDPSFISGIEDIIDCESTLFIVITKSGGTPETLASYFYFSEKCKKEGLKQEEHFLFITDPKKGLLRKIADEDYAADNEDFLTFPVPPKVGGRFSVLTPVGLVPAALIGLDIKKLLKGARDMRDRFMSDDFDKNLPFQLASIQYLMGEKGKPMHVLYPYSQKLIKFADWYRQLLAESIGKEKNDKGDTVHTGLTPVYALGATDQHSQSQLYMEGPNDKFFMFMHVDKLGPSLKIPNPFPDDPTVDYLNGVTFDQLLHTEMQGTAQALTKQDRPNITIELPEVDEEAMGALFMLFEASIAFLGEFYGINAFDQPGVELSKTFTKQLLKADS
jgi:glucose-6-phosphate isomerase